MQGFPFQKLGEVIELVSGQHIAAKDYNNESIGLPYLTGPSDFGVRNPKITRWTEYPKKCALKDDILITVKGSGVGSINVLDIDRVAISRQLMAIRAKNANGRYIELFLSLHQEHFRQAASGAAIPGLSREDVLNLPIPLPPLEEQRRIVAKLDQAFTALDRARAHAEANLADAGKLYEATIRQLFDDRNSWHCEDLNKRVRFIDYRGKTPPKRETGVRLITAKNVRMGFIKEDPCEFILESAYDEWMTRGFPQKGDVLFTTEAPLANVAELDTDEKVVIGQRLITMQTDRTEVLPRFLKWSLLSPQMQQDIREKGTGATVTGIKASLLKKIPFHIPPSFDGQNTISEKCEAAFALRDKLAAQYQSQLTDLADLRQSLLQKAFSGRLT